MHHHELPLVVDYFLNASDGYLRGMGVDPSKLLERDDWIELLDADVHKPDADRAFFYLAWVEGDDLIGHCNINQIEFGQRAYMHLHVWSSTKRRHGVGRRLVRASLDLFMDRFKLQMLCCEPFADNPAPHRVLERVGFRDMGTRTCVPGWINFHQTVRTWCYTRPASPTPT